MYKYLIFVDILLLFIILVLVIWISIEVSQKRPLQQNYQLYNKLTYFVQDLFTQINETNHFNIFYSDNNCIINSNIYLDITGKQEKELYITIIELLAVELARKQENQSVEVIKRRLEQVAYNLNYLTRTITCP